MIRPAVFLDRDGVLNEDVFYPHTGEWEAPLAPEDMRLRPGVAAALARLDEAGYALALVSNQAGYAKGKTSLEALWATHRRLLALLAPIAFADCRYSFSHPDGLVPGFSGPSVDRKPSPYPLLVAAAQHGFDLTRSWMVGDRDTDIVCGRAAGVHTVQVANPHAGDKAGSAVPDYRVADLAAAADVILRQAAERA
ncbi:MAG TPA: HAD-IIIA family hydrolase [Azospirillaceae bacterium]|nr:HAD-IIIA family hydrolase [Azospirillaceae bacterium]